MLSRMAVEVGPEDCGGVTERDSFWAPFPLLVSTCSTFGGMSVSEASLLLLVVALGALPTRNFVLIYSFVVYLI